jgi:hypothetical protein
MTLQNRDTHHLDDLAKEEFSSNGRALQAHDLLPPAGSKLQCLNGRLAQWGGLENLQSVETRCRIQDAIEKGFITVESNTISLLPLRSLPDRLRHLGRDTSVARDTFRVNDVYGNPNSKAPTYLGTTNWRGEANAWSDWDPTLKPQDKIILSVDTAALLRTRSVYIDPESLEHDEGPAGYGDKLGEMFLVLGGVPRAAILGLQYPWGGGDTRRSAWDGLVVS